MSEMKSIFSKFQEFIKQNPAEQIGSEESEAVSLLYRTDWVRILASRESANPKQVVIDVEVTLPLLEESSPKSRTRDRNEVRFLLENFIQYIKYILTLETSGFFVEIIENGCLLSASMCFDKIPSNDIFRLLNPPTLC